ncbi:MAG: LD-carboxypeptidase [Pseudomonadota bacterium]
MKVAIVAPSRTLPEEAANQVLTISEEPEFSNIELYLHPQCFLSTGHFAGPDVDRANALIAVANDPSFDAVWFARGGYGSCRIVSDVTSALTPTAKTKTWIGYSDTGYLLSAFDRAGYGQSVHGPMVADVLREGGDEAIRRVLRFLNNESAGTEPSLGQDGHAIALNASILASLVATSHCISFKDRILMIEEVDEHLYAFDRAMFTAFESGVLDGAAGIRLGRVSAIPENDVPFVETPEDIIRRRCTHRGIPYLGRADIGHDADNKAVPFRRAVISKGHHS